MWIKSYSKFFSDVRPEMVWRTWADVNRWPVWHGDFEYCSLENEFKKGNFYLLKAKGDPAVKIELTEVKEGKSFTDCTRFFGATMYGTHTIETQNDGVIVKNEIRVKGPLKWLWVACVAKKVVSSLPKKTDLLIEYAREMKII